MSAQKRQPIRVLIVSHWFPPVNVIGAVRVGKFAEFLYRAGYDVRVIAGLDPAPEFNDHSLPVGIPPEAVRYIESRIDQMFDRSLGWLFRLVRFTRRKRAGQEAGGNSQRQQKSRHGMREILTMHYYALLRIPDARAGWIRSAVAAGTELTSQWRPDVIFASAPPNSSLVAASRIARACGVPWIAELRDLWVDNPYYEYPPWRRWLDHFLEWKTLRSAAGFVSVTSLWTDDLRRKYPQPAISILNGFVREDFPKDLPQPGPGNVVSVIYTGNIHGSYRDPTPLFEAINLLGPERAKIAVHFYGPSLEQVRSFDAAENILDRIFVHDRVTYKESLALQCSADILLLLQWDNKKDEGNIPAKFFEYLGAGRPILMLGYEHGILAEMIRERNAGLVSNSPARIAEKLREWIAERPQGIPSLGHRVSAGMTRDEQFSSLGHFLDDIVSRSRGEAGAVGTGRAS